MVANPVAATLPFKNITLIILSHSLSSGCVQCVTENFIEYDGFHSSRKSGILLGMTTPKLNWPVLLSELGADVSMGLTFIAGLSYELDDPKYGLTDLAAIIPPKWKHVILVSGIAATGTLRIGNAVIRAFRAAQVTANTTAIAATPAPATTEPGKPS